MPGSAKKFHSCHKFGQKKKNWRHNNFKRKPVPNECPNDEREPAASDGADSGGIGLTSSATESTASCSGRIRRDTRMLQPSELLTNKKRAEEKIRELETTAATKRKSDFLGGSEDAAHPPADTTFTVIAKGDREYGLAVKLMIECANCGDIASTWSSPRASGCQKINPFAVNVLAARAMQSTGNRQAALNDIFAAMNISHRGMHKKTWQCYVKEKLTPTATRAAEKVLKRSADSVRQLYRERNIDNPNNIAVSFDGSWMTRGHRSHIGVGAVIELFSGLVLDYVVYSNFCAGCERGPKDDDPHRCQKNTDKKAGEMEVLAGLTLFQRSLEKHGLRYTTVLSDGDSRMYLALLESNVYGYIKIQKENCVNHVEKHMGTSLRTAIGNHRGSRSESLGGKGKLTGDLVMKPTSYYGWALKSHKGDVEATHNAVMATYHHIASNDSEANHSLCPTGPDSWCRQNAAAAKGEPAPKHRHHLRPHVCEALLPIYERLADRKLLQRCQRGKTQNSNESLHSVIWPLAPKHRHASLFSIEAAVAEAVMRFNAGNLRTSSGILSELTLNPGLCNAKRMAEKDRHRAAESARKRASNDSVQRALRKHHMHKSQSDYMPGAY
ncbi:hypothetical protein HPB48_008777 [Haemaphysalis longicornis]|uniref:Mutator-like transposase domain-containing protein n=1 Tax=Haemaphysalis longicornis TaxID=44386 RepID=A0A9J6FTV1_HAELO|nr:hypothetical protein HPB48_008777 [Haemaphysalis longicornis]